MGERTYTISFLSDEDVALGELAADCREHLLTEVPEADSIRIERTEEDAMDFGSTIVLVLGTPAVVVLCHALRDWLLANRSARVIIKDQNGELCVENVSSKNAAEILERWVKRDAQ